MKQTWRPHGSNTPLHTMGTTLGIETQMQTQMAYWRLSSHQSSKNGHPKGPLANETAGQDQLSVSHQRPLQQTLITNTYKVGQAPPWRKCAGQTQLRHTTERWGQGLSYTMPSKQKDETTESNSTYTVIANEHLHPSYPVGKLNEHLIYHVNGGYLCGDTQSNHKWSDRYGTWLSWPHL